jgi:hypothetical protein
MGRKRKMKQVIFFVGFFGLLFVLATGCDCERAAHYYKVQIFRETQGTSYPVDYWMGVTSYTKNVDGSYNLVQHNGNNITIPPGFLVVIEGR